MAFPGQTGACKGRPACYNMSVCGATIRQMLMSWADGTDSAKLALIRTWEADGMEAVATVHSESWGRCDVSTRPPASALKVEEAHWSLELLKVWFMAQCHPFWTVKCSGPEVLTLKLSCERLWWWWWWWWGGKLCSLKRVCPNSTDGLLGCSDSFVLSCFKRLFPTIKVLYTYDVLWDQIIFLSCVCACICVYTSVVVCEHLLICCVCVCVRTCDGMCVHTGACFLWESVCVCVCVWWSAVRSEHEKWSLIITHIINALQSRPCAKS